MAAKPMIIESSLNELDSVAYQAGDSGILQTVTECLAVLRAFCYSALHDDIPDSVWVNGLALDSFMLDSCGRAWFSPSSELPWLPPEASKRYPVKEKTIAYGMGVALLNVLCEEHLDPVLYSVLENLCHDKPESRPALSTILSWCDELGNQLYDTSSIGDDSALLYRQVIAGIFHRLYDQHEVSSELDDLHGVSDQMSMSVLSPDLLRDIRSFHKSHLRPIFPPDCSARLIQLLFSDSDQLLSLRRVTAAAVRKPEPPAVPMRRSSVQKVPSAYTSHLTHFTPIVVAASETHQQLTSYDKHFLEDESKVSYALSGGSNSSANKETASRALADKLRQIAKENRRIHLADVEADATVNHIRSLLHTSDSVNSRHQNSSSVWTDLRVNRTTNSSNHNNSEHWLASKPLPPPRPNVANHNQHSKDTEDRDSGIVDKSFASPLERLLSADSLSFQGKLSSVIRIINNEFSVAGVSETQADLLMFAEYIVSLVNLRRPTFFNAIRERFPDIYWRDELLMELFSVVNNITLSNEDDSVDNDNTAAAAVVPTATSSMKSRMLQLNQQLFLTQRDIQSLQRLGSSGYKDIELLRDRLEFLESMRRQAEMGIAEEESLSLEYCVSLASTGDQLYLKKSSTSILNERLVFRQGLVYSGDSSILLAFLFCKQSVSSGFLSEFLLGYRYYLSSDALLSFILRILKLTLPSCLNPSSLESVLFARGLLLLDSWITDYYIVDFAVHPALFNQLMSFINSLPTQLRDSLSVQFPSWDTLVLAIEGCTSVQSVDMLYPAVSVNRDSSPVRPCSLMSWPLFKVFSDSRITTSEYRQLIQESIDGEGGFSPTTKVSMSVAPLSDDSFSVFDYTESTLAAGLCSISQELFLNVHPVQFLSTSSDRYCVSLNNWITFCSHLAKWVQAEVIAASSSKNRTTITRRLWSVAGAASNMCHHEVSCSMTEALTSPRLQWAPGFSKLDSKSNRTRKKLISQRQSLAHNPLPSLPNDNVPHPQFVLHHLQRLEVGSFRLVNGGVKWYKIHDIVQSLLSIRLARQRSPPTDCPTVIKQSLWRRIDRLANMDLDLLQ